MSKPWTVSPGIGATLGGGPLEGTASSFIITRSDGSTLSATFVGAGAAWGGPASFTYSDNDTPGWPGELVWASGLPPNEILLKNPNDGFMLSAGTAPRQLLSMLGFPQDPTALSGFSLMILGFGSSNLPVASVVGPIQDSVAAASIMADIKFGTKGYLVSGVRAYAAVVSAAKGVDVGGVAAMAGRWIFR